MAARFLEKGDSRENGKQCYGAELFESSTDTAIKEKRAN